ncbi:HNH endonuclease [Sinobaca qinghaiensis]|uniref:HNH endonuclease n=1 Tax=Sinobaca qinghaiensis TaxID=342944 RepID=A0A419V5J0_9BACL|nr:HNH endonuclease domain-containing protein [Sinobaca qinghaiensis]RKD75254.1 HNH endonuclease [Sinobaca qinghaiensis]
MDTYIKDWHNIILNCSFDNTYKMVWAKSLVELAVNSQEKNDKVTFNFREISELCLKYYWNQTIYFNLIQGSNIKKPPEILTYVKELIGDYITKTGKTQPIRFEKLNLTALELESKYEKVINKISNTLKSDVCWRFKNLAGITYELYDLDRDKKTVTFNKEDILNIKEQSDFLFSFINYKWTQMLESFNFSPKISQKVRGIDEGKVKRSPLKKYHEYLDLMCSNGKRICFYCNKEINETDLSIDHVIPWSFMFSDDIWNLVYCHKNENSEKSNRLPSENDINRLEERNIRLMKLMENSDFHKNKNFDQLQLANEKNYVRSFWISCKY